MFYSVLALIPLTTVRVFLPFRQALLVISTADFDVLFVSHKLPTYLLTTYYGVLMRAAMQSAVTHHTHPSSPSSGQTWNAHVRSPV